MEQDPSYERAKKRVESIKAFYIHLIVYVLVNAGLIVYNAIISPGSWWFYWTTIGWGIGLVVHAVSVFVFEGVFGSQWEEKKIKQYMDKEKTG